MRTEGRINAKKITAVAALVAGVALVASGCGSSGGAEATASERQAADGDWTSRVVCPERNSFAFPMSVQNLLPMDVAPAAKDIDCADWSGVSTPATAFNNTSVAAGQTRVYRLEPRTNSRRNWTMRFTPVGMSPTQLRMGIEMGGGANIITARSPTMRTLQITEQWRCTFVPFGPIDAADTPLRDIRALKGDEARTVTLAVRGGQAGVVAGCRPIGGGGA